jgi:tRNA 2-selenouridine synthase
MSVLDSFVAVDRILDRADLPLIDVRSPSEFARGHIPGATSVPLFVDEERAEIGTLYKQVGREPAVARGLEIATAKANQLVRRIQEVAQQAEFLIHCWRGGMRSRGVAWLCADCGMRPAVLEGGYKSFRRAAHQSFQQPQQVILLAGQTGAGKTRLLHRLREAGQQVIDLEALACHRGSVFGGIDQHPQPTVEQFENQLFMDWRQLDPAKPVWIEGESQAIGKVNIPRPVWQQMSQALMIFVEVDREQRLDFLLQDYGELPASDLSAAMQRLKKRLGGARLKAALDAIDQNDRRTFASIALDYYDKTYLKALKKRSPETVIKLPLAAAGDRAAIETFITIADQQTKKHSRTLDGPRCLIN